MTTAIGIDLISFYSPRYYLDLKVLAEKRDIDADKFYKGIGQEKMAVPPPDEDIVTIGASAALPLLQYTDPEEIDLLLFATESGVDQSKSAGIFVHGLLGLSSRCRAVELKQACYSGTAALQMAAAMIQRGAARKALVIAADVARYELKSPGEATQGAGGVAMLVTENPRLLRLDAEAGFYLEDVMDFWRPNYREEALVDGKYSTQVYIRALLESWKQYAEQTHRSLSDLYRFCYHIPFTRMAEKAHQQLWKKINREVPSEKMLAELLGESLIYSKRAGNCYSASMYVGLTSLLDQHAGSLAGKRLGLFSYGSGCMGEFFSGVVSEGYEQHLLKKEHQKLLDERIELSYQQYEDIYHLDFPEDGGEHEFARYKTGAFRLAGVSGHKRLYQKVGL